MLLLAALSAATAQPANFSSARPNCPRTTSYYARQRGKPVRPQKLTDLPDANVYSAVYRRVGGCEVPIVVKYRVGGR